jgi:DNA polymerase-1
MVKKATVKFAGNMWCPCSPEHRALLAEAEAEAAAKALADGKGAPPEEIPWPPPCPLYGSHLISPCIGPSGNRRPGGILVLGEAPGRVEDERGAGFVGPSGQELRAALTEAGVPEDVLTFANAVRCRPPGNKTPTARIVNACAGLYLLPLIRELAPAVIVAAGATALKALMRTQEAAVMRLNGLEVPGAPAGLPPIVASVHPAWVLRNVTANRPKLLEAARMVRTVWERESGATVAPALALSVWWPKDLSYFREAMQRLGDLRERAALQTHRVCYDLETNGLSPWDRKRPPKVLTVALAVTPTEALVIPIDHPEAPAWSADERANLLEALRVILTDPNTHKVAHNAKFDDEWLRVCFGWSPEAPDVIGDLPGVLDPMLGHSLIAPGEPHGLDALVMRHCRETYGDYWLPVFALAKEAEATARKEAKRRKGKADDRAENEGRFDFGRVPLSLLAPYNGYDVMATLACWDVVEPRLRETGETLRALRNTLAPAQKALREMEIHGLAVDRTRLIQLTGEWKSKDVQARLGLASLPVVAAFAAARPDGEINFGSTQQKAALLYEAYGLKAPKLTEGGAPSTDAEAVKLLLANPLLADEPRAALGHMSALAEATKVLGTYLLPAGDMIGSDGRIHTAFNLHSARTGRLSSSRPNLQNQPPGTRPMFGSRFPGGLILSFDFAQLEACVIACFCEDPVLLSIFREGRDFHIMNAALMLGKDPGRAIKDGPDKDWGEVTEADRQQAKGAVSFGLMYGRQDEALAQDLGIPLEAATAMRTEYFARVPVLTEWIKRVVAWARRTGYVDTPFGRRRWLPDLHADDRFLRGEAERQAVNTPVQGAASDLTLASLVRIERGLKARGLSAVPVVTVHDSIVVDSPREEAQAVAEYAVGEMEDTSMHPWVIVPLRAEIKAGRRWDEK